MIVPLRRNSLHLSLLSFLGIVFFWTPALSRAGDVPRCLRELEKMCPEQLGQLYAQAELGNIPVGVGQGRLLHLTDRFAGVKVWVSNRVWRGKYIDPNTYYINRWIFGIRAIDSHYHIEPSWLDGRPCIAMQYAPGTPLFANVRDELREISPGLYLGPVFDRFPCPRFRGYVAIYIDPCQK